MVEHATRGLCLVDSESDASARPRPGTLKDLFSRLGVTSTAGRAPADRLPFCNDATGGSESELQAVVAGPAEAVDLPLSIEQSDYFANILRRARAGDTSRHLIGDLERFLADNREGIWENSWVRFPRQRLNSQADQVLRHDLLADKGDPAAGLRQDARRFFLAGPSGEELLRVPVSYLVKLALADALGATPELPSPVRETGRRLMGHYLNDNTSPETFSFHVVPLTPAAGAGQALARETARRLLFTQLLVQYANVRFGLLEARQRAMIYFAPHTPQRQKDLNDLIADGFYRELFMSPCLSGWEQGEKKHRYMHLCHQVLGRSQLNAVAKLREAGIITNNLVVLPNVSNTSLANNGSHVSLGSRFLTGLRRDPGSGFDAGAEKYAGDLAIKIVEHFLPLFVGTCSAAPYRLGFGDFHPEKALGFLPHELDFTHLRMFWRRWRKKASLSVFGRALTPFGPTWLDRTLAAAAGLRGDFVPDHRLLDYPVSLLSTLQSPALDGRPGNQEKLKKDLAEMGVFDSQMSLYLLYKQREFASMGFCGFEGRHYSLFPDLVQDMGMAVNLQLLVTALAYRYLAEGRVSHRHIPDHPNLESERRQIFFGGAVGLPTFFVHRQSRNLFLRRILQKTRRVRPSSRYPGFLRVYQLEYRRALVEVLREDAADLIAALGLEETLADLQRRVEEPDLHGAAGKLTREILDEVGASAPLRVPAREFNAGAERFYREKLRLRHFAAGLDLLEEDLRGFDRLDGGGDETLRGVLNRLLQGRSAAEFLREVREDLLDEVCSADTLRRVIGLSLAAVHREAALADNFLHEGRRTDDRPSVHRA